MAHLARYYCIDSRPLDHIISQCLEQRRKWHKMNSYIRTLSLGHAAEVKLFSWSLSTGREPLALSEKISTPTLDEMIRPLKHRGAIMAEGEYREWEYFKRLYNMISHMDGIDDEIIEDFIFYSDQVIGNLLSRCYGHWFAPGASLREIPKFFPELEELYAPFINDFPTLRDKIPINIDLEYIYNYDPERRVTHIPAENVRTLRKELEKRKQSMVYHFQNTNWVEDQIKEMLVPLFFDILDFAWKNDRSVMVRY
ncbi:MAG: hypothetical protein K8T10_16795 [Candidatus Eremiobacteraeota bacterium]|nr:hypothetical protein [Candidatus Eremiobacteraeota bacterium]